MEAYFHMEIILLRLSFYEILQSFSDQVVKIAGNIKCTEWSREQLLEAWMTEPIACCQKCGVMPPAHLLDGSMLIDASGGDHLDRTDHSPAGCSISLPSNCTVSFSLDINSFAAFIEYIGNTFSLCACWQCNICMISELNENEPPPMSCGHQFCKSCWERYSIILILLI